MVALEGVGPPTSESGNRTVSSKYSGIENRVNCRVGEHLQGDVLPRAAPEALDLVVLRPSSGAVGEIPNQIAPCLSWLRLKLENAVRVEWCDGVVFR